jgi:hypothetical protein
LCGLALMVRGWGVVVMVWCGRDASADRGVCYV